MIDDPSNTPITCVAGLQQDKGFAHHHGHSFSCSPTDRGSDKHCSRCVEIPGATAVQIHRLRKELTLM